ncbi:hypothetical protein VP1G_05918 [Cytospora mali]|uniref:Uncharacterized protein n=1 Tax=Cytospora mali TaxID=578113 RepID=A0A194V3V7_CYTMA|nr:hypothetical protein VP1G_05918 [Valsa mali var. pyri (nom. inval.)]
MEPTTLELSSSSTSAPATSTKAAIATTPTGPTTVGPEYSFPTTASTTTVPFSRNQLPTEAIVAIAVCTALAVSGAVLLLCCVLRRRQKQQEDYSSDMRRRISRIMQDITVPPASSPQPLISPTQSYTADRPPLTPPLRLRDRKLLPSLLRPLSRPESIVFGSPFDTHHSNYSNSSYYSSQSQKKVDQGGGGSFPASPICSPTYDKLEPQQEKTHKKAPSSLVNSAMSLSPEPSSPPYTRLKSPPPVGFTFPPRYSPDNLYHHQYTGSPPRKGATSSSSLLRKANTSTSTTSSDYNQDYQINSKTSSIGTEATVVGPQEQQTHHQQQHSTVIFTSRASPTPPSSPTRPRRPHDEPLEIPDLVSPLTTTSPTSPSPGPPPNRALPPPPMPGSGRSSSAASEIGIATTTTTTTTVPNMTSAGTRRSPGSISLRSLQEQEQEEDLDDHHQSSGSSPVEGKRSRTVSRDSWGSWEDTSGDRSIVGVAMSPSLSGSLSGRGVGTVFPYPDH